MNSKFQELIDEITRRRSQPEDMYEVAAIIESIGWSDDRVSEVFGVENVFALASDLWDAIRERVVYTPYQSVEKKGFFSTVSDLTRNFLRGLIFALPMAISVFSMLTLRFSLWSYENLTLELATSIAIGTIMSFLTVGGFTQSIARRGFFYITMDYYNMARRMTFSFIKIGYAVTIIIALAFFFFNSFFEVFPLRMTATIVLYYFFLTAIWLSVTVMYILRRELAFTGLLVSGIALVYVLFRIFELDIIISQLISLVVVSISGMALVMHFFRKAEKKLEKGISPTLPRLSITIYSVMPYFIYGFLYFAFLYVDRIIAWSTNNKDYMPYLIWFRGPYELGLDFALLMLMFPMGVIEVVITKLMQDLEITQKFSSMKDVGSLAKSYVKMYINRVILILLVSIATAIMVYIAARYIDNGFLFGRQSGYFENGVTHFVFIAALTGYSVFSLALMNAIILFSLSQPEMVNKSILPALIVNLVIGFLLSRWIDHSYAVLGMLAGSVVFSALTTDKVLKVIRNLDYYLYAIV